MQPEATLLPARPVFVGGRDEVLADEISRSVARPLRQTRRLPGAPTAAEVLSSGANAAQVSNRRPWRRHGPGVTSGVAPRPLLASPYTTSVSGITDAHHFGVSERGGMGCGLRRCGEHR